MKRLQRLESAKNWLGTYEGNKVVRDYRRRYGVAWDVAFLELEMLNVPIDPAYKEQVLQSVAVQTAVKRHQRFKKKAQQTDVWSEYSDNDLVLARSEDCLACEMFRPLDEQGLCPVCALALERDLIRQRNWDYSAAAFSLSDEAREELRRKIVAEYGEGLELISPD